MVALKPYVLHHVWACIMAAISISSLKCLQLLALVPGFSQLCTFNVLLLFYQHCLAKCLSINCAVQQLLPISGILK